MSSKIETNWSELKIELINNCAVLKQETGLKDIEKFKSKVSYVINTIDSYIEDKADLTFKVQKGNAKLPTSTLIASCGSWFNCVGRTKGFCSICQYCYDKYIEVMYKERLLGRTVNELVFRTADSQTIADSILQTSTRNSKLVRFNEVGEMRNTEDLKKLIEVSNIVYESKSLKSYVYTHNKQLDFSIDRPNLIINGSNFKADNLYEVVEQSEVSKLSADYKRCICDCNNCNLCSTNKDLKIYEVLRK